MFSAAFTEGVEETLFSLPVGGAGFWTWETDTHQGESRWMSCNLNQEVILHASSARDIAERVAVALERFDTVVRVEVLRIFCRVCGELACGKHR